MYKEKNSIENIGYIVKNCYKFDKKIFGIFGFYTILIALNPFIGLFLPKYLIDEITGDSNIILIVVYISLFFLLSALFGFLIPYLRGKYEPRIMRLRLLFIEMFNKKVMEIDFEYLEDPTILNDAESSLRAINNNTTGIEGILNNLFNIFGILISFMGYIGIILTLNPFILVYLVLSVFLTYLMTVKVKKHEHSLQNDISQIERKSNYLINTMYDFSYGKEIRLYNISSWISKKFERITGDVIKLNKSIGKKYLTVSNVNILITFVRDSIAYAYLIYSVLFSNMSIGEFTLYFTTIVGFSGVMNSFITLMAELHSQNLYINDYRKFMEIKNAEKVKKQRLLPDKKPYCIKLEDISFKYPQSDVWVLKNVSLKINAGEKISIVGINGSGKTTLIKLICRLYQPTSGRIFLNGIDINEFEILDYYKIFSVLFQDYKLFAFTILQNISLSVIQEDVNVNRAKEACTLAGLMDKFESLNKGLNTNLFKIFDDEGIDLSGGEKQKLALARALYRNGDIIILDEPTASLDPISESQIYEKFNQLTKEKTSIYISHRLSSCKFCDKIYLLENGHILEQGSHNSLIEENGRYAELFKLQSQYYNN